jgi:hypothetical protein
MGRGSTSMTAASRPGPLGRLVPANFKDPIGLVRRILSSRDPAAYFAIGNTALAMAATPLDLALAAAERRRYRRVTAPRHPVILVTGAPRSGTTVLSQVLLHHLPVTYLNNLTAVFPRAPIVANRLFGRLLRKPPVSLRSYYGRTVGFAAENDALHIWDRWLGPDRYTMPTRIPPAAADAMRRFFAAYEEAFGRPVLNKNNALATGVGVVAEALPTARFIVIRREPAYAVQSILGARELIQGSRAEPYGVGDPTAHAGTADPIADVCAQVLYHERRIEEQRRELGPERFWIVEYEAFCRAPHEIVERVAREMLDVPLDVAALRAALPPLGNTNRITLPAAEFARIQDTLARLSASPARGTDA